MDGMVSRDRRFTVILTLISWLAFVTAMWSCAVVWEAVQFELVVRIVAVGLLFFFGVLFGVVGLEGSRRIYCRDWHVTKESEKV